MFAPVFTGLACTVAKFRAGPAYVRISFPSSPFISLAALIVALGLHTPRATAGGAGDPPTIFVDAALISGGNDGSSWTDAFQGRLGLQAALASIRAGSVTQIWVADGEYAPAPPGGAHEISFVLHSGIAVLGGFDGGETSIDERDPARNVAVLTGDLNGNDSPDSFAGMGDNSFHVVRIINADATCLLDGVTVRRGYTESSPFSQGPGANIFVQGGAPVIRQCIVERGAADEGGGLGCLASQLHVEGCLFTRNSASSGGGVFHSQSSTGTFVNCRFEENYCELGGGFYNGEFDGSGPENKPLLQDCVFFNNQGGSGMGFADIKGQAVLQRCRFLHNLITSGGGGGGMFLVASSAVVRECDFVGNAGFGDGGGALHISMFFPPASSPPQFINCRFVGNHDVLLGGPADFINCTIANGILPDLPGLPDPGFFVPPVPAFPCSSAHLRNCIVWGNPSVGAPGLAGIFPECFGQITIDDSLVQSWDGSLPGTGTAALDPLFVDSAGLDGVPGTEDDDLRLLPDSPAIDAGNDASVPRGVEVDLDGNPRFVDGDGDRVAQVDIGAYERPAAAVPADLNGDGHVTGVDLAILLGQWGRCPNRGAPGGCPADLDRNGIVNGLDLAILLAAWG